MATRPDIPPSPAPETGAGPLAADQSPPEAATPEYEGQPLLEDARPEPPKPWWKRAFSAVAAVAVAIFSFGAKLKGLLLLLPKALTGAKFATTSLSMIVSIGAYTLLWGLPFAIGFVLLMLVHEMGHVWQLRREGIPASAPLFIPFLGAAVGMKQLPDDAGAEARVGLAGPVLGSIGVLVPVGLYLASGDPFYRALAFVGFFLNLFNLLPILPLDGGRALQALTPWITFVAFLAAIPLAVFFPSPVVFLILVFGGLETWRRFKGRNSPEAQRFQQVPARVRVGVAATYVGLVVVLGLATSLSFLPRPLG